MGQRADTIGPRGAKSPFADFIGRAVKWIPGDVIVLYGALVTGLEGVNPSPNPSLLWLIVFWILTPVVAVGGAFATGESLRVGKLVLAFLAFGIWSLGLPDSGWQAWEAVRDNPIQSAAAAAIAGLLFGQLAEGLARKWDAP